jgi:tRNA threonylcarbamoyladenosine biosynthesis protein TsaB
MTALLAFDTSTDRLHLGLQLGPREWHEEGESGPAPGRDLVACVMRLIARAGIGLGALDAIAFGQGPGAFTGLRSASAAAQGLALGSGRPLIAVDTLMAVAEDARQQLGLVDVWAAIDARMDEIYAARYAHDGRSWHTLAAPALYAPQDLSARWRERPPQAVAGNALRTFEGRLACLGAIQVGEARPGARALLACAQEAWPGQSFADPAAAQPLYLRHRVASTTAEREARKAVAP